MVVLKYPLSYVIVKGGGQRGTPLVQKNPHLKFFFILSQNYLKTLTYEISLRN